MSKDWHFLASQISSEEMQKRIAGVLRGSPSAEFLSTLADYFDPPQRRPKARRAWISRNVEGRPSKKNDALGIFMADGRDRGDKLDALVAEAEEKFGAKRSTCINALKRERELRDLWKWLQDKEVGAKID